MDNLNVTNSNEVTASTDAVVTEPVIPPESSVEREVKRDTTLDVASLLKTSREAPEPEETPLEKMKREKANGGQGLIVTNQALEEANRPEKIVSKTEADMIEETDEYLDEQDKLIKAAQNIKITKKIQHPIEMAKAMDQIEEYAVTGKIPVDENGESLIAVKTEEDKEVPGVPKDDPSISATNAEANNQEDSVNNSLVTILIDKTGFGGEFVFTPEEQEKITSATEIRLTEVEEVDLSTIKVSSPQKSFVDTVESYQFSSSRTNIVLPASRYKAAVTGLSYGELGDIAIDIEQATFDQVRKRLSVVYNKMVNPSIGKFQSFDEFLKHTAWVDIDLAIFGLAVATFPEVTEIGLRCQAEKCMRDFNFTYSPRTLLRYEKCNERFATAVDEVLSTQAKDAKQLHDKSPVNVHARYKLPESGMIVEIGFASAYEYMYNVLENVNPDIFNKRYPDDVNNILKINTALLGLIRAVYVPSPHGGYDKYTDFDDVIQALCYIKADEIAWIGSILDKYGAAYTPHFELRDVVCPHCGTVTNVIRLDISSLVFQRYKELIGTTYNVDNISVL